MTRAAPVRILVCDDHLIMRQGLRALFEDEPGFEVVAEASGGEEALDLVSSTSPDVVVMDLNLPTVSGIEVTRRLIAGEDPPIVVALSMHAEQRQVREALRAGASGYVLKESAVEELVRAIRVALKGELYLEPRVTELLANEVSQGRRNVAPDNLTDREKEVLRLIADGKSTREIAAILWLSPKTVETHRRHLMEKLGLNNVASLTKYALRVGLTSLDF